MIDVTTVSIIRKPFDSSAAQGRHTANYEKAVLTIRAGKDKWMLVFYVPDSRKFYGYDADGKKFESTDRNRSTWFRELQEFFAKQHGKRVMQ